MGMPVTVKGQVTIPKSIRDRLGLTPGSRVEFEVDGNGRVFLAKAGLEREAPSDPDRFEKLKGTATAMEGMSTDDLMKLLRGEDD
jgi:AbrB family looped-hinge helix DNA binding protein